MAKTSKTMTAAMVATLEAYASGKSEGVSPMTTGALCRRGYLAHAPVGTMGGTRLAITAAGLAAIGGAK